MEDFSPENGGFQKWDTSILYWRVFEWRTQAPMTSIYTMTPEYYRFEGLDMVGYPPQKKLWKIHENQSRSK